MDLAEVYRVIYDGPTDKLRGVILSSDLDNGCQYLFKDEGLDDCNPRDIVFEYLRADFYMNADKEIDKEYIHVEPVMLPTPQKTVFLSDDGKRFLKIYYAIFRNAVEANVKVKFRHPKSKFDLYGAISARTGAILHPAYSSIIFFKELGEKMNLEPGNETSLPLSRPFVAVPLGFELILEFGLVINDELFQDKLFIDAETDAKKLKTVYEIPCSHFKIQVEIDWRSKRNPRKLEPLDLSSEEEDS